MKIKVYCGSNIPYDINRNTNAPDFIIDTDNKEDLLWLKRNLYDPENDYNDFVTENNEEIGCQNKKWFRKHFPELTKDECDDEDKYYFRSATRGDYSPSCPRNAPGMSVNDFI